MENKNKKDIILQVRISKLEKKVIQDKADFLGLSVADYVRECCIYSNTTDEFMKKLHAAIPNDKNE